MAVRYDDRLRTVLGQPAEHPHDRAIRWRQLVELLARGGEGSDRDLFNEAIEAIRADADSVDEQVRMAAARSVANLPLPLELVCAFAGDKLGVAAPVLAAARLTASEWAQVTACATPECRRFIAALRTEGLDHDTHHAPAAAPVPAPGEDPHSAVPSISEVVARIERIRHLREPAGDADEVPAHQEIGEVVEAAKAPAAAPQFTSLFRWECDESGEIAWVEGAPRGALIGRSIARTAPEEGLDQRVGKAFSLRLPFRDACLELAEGSVLAGRWKMSGVPAFDPANGRFSGYRGLAERDDRSMSAAHQDPDALRELAHEIRTPLNAIIGFAEMISGQYLGPADEGYRGRAQEIVAQARLLLTAIEDLDFAAQLHSRAGPRPEVHLGKLVEGIIGNLREAASERGVELEASRTTKNLNVAADPELAERLVMRMCTAVIDQAAPGERLRVDVDRTEAHCSVSISRPARLQELADMELFSAGEGEIAIGFWLRLARNLARLVGGDLQSSATRLALVFPCP